MAGDRACLVKENEIYFWLKRVEIETDFHLTDFVRGKMVVEIANGLPFSGSKSYDVVGNQARAKLIELGIVPAVK